MRFDRPGRRSDARALALAAILGLSLPLAGNAQSTDHGGHSAHAHGEAGETKAAAERTEGEIRKVDPASGKVTIRHGEISNLQMGPMTMVFTAREPKLLADLAAGDKVTFRVIRDEGRLVITEIDKVR